MFSQESSSWFPWLLFPFALLVYVAFLMGVLWLATRVVRHAWYWRASSPETPLDADALPPGASER